MPTLFICSPLQGLVDCLLNPIAALAGISAEPVVIAGAAVPDYPSTTCAAEQPVGHLLNAFDCFHGRPFVLVDCVLTVYGANMRLALLRVKRYFQCVYRVDHQLRLA